MLDRGLFFAAQPFGIPGFVGQVEERKYADDRRREAFSDKHPLPAGQAELRAFQQPARYRAAHHQRHRHTKIVNAIGRATLVLREPVGQVQHHPRRQPGFGHAQQKPQDIEAGFVVGKHHCRRHQAPGHHDPAQPDTRADLVQHQVARDFEHRIADEENPRTQGERRIAQAGVRLQGVLGKTDIGTVDDRHREHQGDKGQDAPADFAQRLLQSGIGHGVLRLLFLWSTAIRFFSGPHAHRRQRSRSSPSVTDRPRRCWNGRPPGPSHKAAAPRRQWP